MRVYAVVDGVKGTWLCFPSNRPDGAGHCHQAGCTEDFRKVSCFPFDSSDFSALVSKLRGELVVVAQLRLPILRRPKQEDPRLRLSWQVELRAGGLDNVMASVFKFKHKKKVGPGWAYIEHLLCMHA